MGREVRRLLIGLLLIAVPAVFVLLGVRGFVVRNAVVTAHLDVVKAPIDGEVADIAVVAGTALNESANALTLSDPRSDPARVEALTAEIGETLRAIENRRSSLDWHDAALTEQQRQLKDTVSALKLDLKIEHEVAHAQVEASEARIAFLSAQLERTRRLQGSSASEASLDAAEADLKEHQAKLAAQRLEVERVEQRLAFLDRSLLVLESMDDAVSLAASIRELRARRHQVTVALADLESRMDALGERLLSEQETLDRVSKAEVTLPGGIVVWEAFVEEGDYVTRGSPLLSFVHCNQRLAQATVDDSTTELIRPQHPVVLYLYGEDRPIEGRVQSIYGSAGHIARSRSLAANVQDVGPTDAIVLIEIGTPANVDNDHRLCDIGRTAYVEFEGIGFLDPFVNRLF